MNRIDHEKVFTSLLTAFFIMTAIFTIIVVRDLLDDDDSTGGQTLTAIDSGSGSDLGLTAPSPSNLGTVAPSNSGTSSSGSSEVAGGSSSATTAPASSDGQSAPAAGGGGQITDAGVAVPPGEESQGVSDSEILVGSSSAVTGVMEFPAATEMPSAYLKMINDEGGVNGRKIRYLVYDQDATDSNRALANVRKLNEEDKFFAFVGGAHPFSDVIYPYMEEHGVPVVGEMSEISQVYKRTNAFPTGSYVATQCRDMGDYAARSYDMTKVAMFTFNVYISADCAAGFRSAMDAHGIEVSYVSETPIGQPDFTQDVVRARQAGAQFILCATDGGTCTRVAQAAQRQDWRPEFGFGGCSPCFSQTFVSAMGDFANGSLFAMSGHLWTATDNPGAKKMVDTVLRYNPSYDRFDGAGLPTWAGANLFVDALRAIGDDVTRSRLMGWIAGQSAWRAGGDFIVPLDFTRRGSGEWFRTPLNASMMGEVRDGDLYEVTGEWVSTPLGADPTPDASYQAP